MTWPHSTTNQLVSNWTLFKNQSANQWLDFSLELTTRVTSVTYIAVFALPNCVARLLCRQSQLWTTTLITSAVLTKQNALPWCPTESLWHEFPLWIYKDFFFDQTCFSNQLCHLQPHMLLLVATTVIAVVVFHGPKFDGVLHQWRPKKAQDVLRDPQVKGDRLFYVYVNELYVKCLAHRWCQMPSFASSSRCLTYFSTDLDFIVWFLTQSTTSKTSHCLLISLRTLHLNRERGLGQWFLPSSCTFPNQWCFCFRTQKFVLHLKAGGEALHFLPILNSNFQTMICQVNICSSKGDRTVHSQKPCYSCLS